MLGEDLTIFRRKLEDLSRRLDARTREFGQKGEFLGTQQAIRQRHDQLTAKVDAATREGTTWTLIEAECARDFESILDDVRQLEERFDADAMKPTSPG